MRRIVSGSDHNTAQVLDADTDVAVGKPLVITLQVGSMVDSVSPTALHFYPVGVTFVRGHCSTAHSVSMLSPSLKAQIHGQEVRGGPQCRHSLLRAPLAFARRSTLQ